MIGGGLTLSGIGGAVFAIALPISMQEYAGGTSVFITIISGLAVAAGWFMMVVGVTRLLAKADDLYQIYVEKHTKRSVVSTHADTVTSGRSSTAVDRFLAGS
jgi:hypothetical protein